jgi:hypothetical protein
MSSAHTTNTDGKCGYSLSVPTPKYFHRDKHNTADDHCELTSDGRSLAMPKKASISGVVSWRRQPGQIVAGLFRLLVQFFRVARWARARPSSEESRPPFREPIFSVISQPHLDNSPD